MSRPDDAQRASLSFGNPFRMIFPKGSYLSPKLLALLTTFEQTLAESLRKLKRDNISDVLSLSWMSQAMASLSETHTNINNLTAALQFPVSDWDHKWLDMYLNSSVKLLDICNVLTSELSRLGQHHLLVKYALRILTSIGTSPSSEDLKRVHSPLHDWMEQIHSSSPKLDNCTSVLQELSTTVQLVKVKNSAKGKVLLRALYGVNIVTVFICSVLTAALTGCSKPLMDLPVSNEFLWAGAFLDLQSGVNGEMRKLFSSGKSRVLKELDSVKPHAEKLHDLSIRLGQTKEQKPQTEEERSCGDKKNEMPIAGEEKLENPSSDLAKSAECFTRELDLLNKQLDDFFHLVLAGRDALLSGLSNPNVQSKGKAAKHR